MSSTIFTLENRSFEKKDYVRTQPSNLVFKSDCLFTQNFLNQIDAILKTVDAKSFKSLSKRDKLKVTSQLENLLETETRWKDLVIRSKYRITKAEELFPNEINIFTEKFYELFFPPKGVHKKNVIQKYGSKKVEKFFVDLLIYFDRMNLGLDSGVTCPFLRDDIIYSKLADPHFLDRLVRKVNPKEIFSEIVKISMKKAYDSNVNIEYSNKNRFTNHTLSEDLLLAKRTDLQYLITDYLSVYLTNILLYELSEDKKLNPQRSTIDHKIRNLKFIIEHYKTDIRRNLTHPQNEWYLELSSITMILLSLFETTAVVQDIRKSTTTSGNKTRVVITYVLDSKIDNSLGFSHHIPRIIPPNKSDSKKGINDWISPVKKGTYSVEASSYAIRALNIAQRKEFRINEQFLDLLKTLDLEEYRGEFITLNDYWEKNDDYSSWQNTIFSNPVKDAIFRHTANILKIKHYLSHTQIVEMCCISSLQCDVNQRKLAVREELLTARSNRQLLLTSIDIGEKFKKFPLYYGTLLDFRLRMYPLPVTYYPELQVI